MAPASAIQPDSPQAVHYTRVAERCVLDGELTAANDAFWETSKHPGESDLTSLKGLTTTEWACRHGGKDFAEHSLKSSQECQNT
jgi:hypothetical protein